MEFPITGVKKFDRLVSSAIARGFIPRGGPSDMSVEIGHNASHTWFAEVIDGVPFVSSFSDDPDDDENSERSRPSCVFIQCDNDVPTYVGHW